MAQGKGEGFSTGETRQEMEQRFNSGTIVFSGDEVLYDGEAKSMGIPAAKKMSELLAKAGKGKPSK